jgi:hypothetical protein
VDFEKAGIDEAGDDFVRGVRVDFEVPAKSADGGEFVARVELTGDDGFRGRVDNLLVDGQTGFEVDAEREPRRRRVL